ncbi:hypothetical protein Tco_0114296, partial [Tanacetum coccineum]
MTPNRRKLKRRIKPPKRYEGSVSAFIKRNDSDHDTSNDENSKEDMRNKAMNVDEVCLDQNGLETGEIAEVLDKESAEKEQVQNEDTRNDDVISEDNRGKRKGKKLKRIWVEMVWKQGKLKRS